MEKKIIGKIIFFYKFVLRLKILKFDNDKYFRALLLMSQSNFM